MARYGGDYGMYREWWPDYTWERGRRYGAGFGDRPGPEDFRGGYYRGGEARKAFGVAFERQYTYDRDYGAGSSSGRYRAVAPSRADTRARDSKQVRAADIMTRDPEAVTGDTAVADAARKMKELDVGIIPVVDDLQRRHLEGVITDRDIAIRIVAEEKDGNTKVSDAMTRDVESCAQHASVRDILEVMQREQVRRVPIVDPELRLVGIVAQADLAVEYAGLDPDREITVEETIERISEPARPRRRREAPSAWR